MRLSAFSAFIFNEIPKDLVRLKTVDCSGAISHQTRVSEPMPTSLASQLENERLLLLSAPSASSPAFEEQMDLLDGTVEQRKAHDVMLGVLLRQGESRIEDQTLTDQECQELQQRYSLGNCFEVLLIEKGGKLLHRDDTPLKTKVIFSHFDAATTDRQKGAPPHSV